MDAQKSISETYDAKGDTKNAFSYFKDYIATRDSLINSENTNKITSIEMNYQFEKKQHELEIEQDKKDAIQKSKLYSAIFGVVISLILSIVVFRGYKRKQKDNIILNQQKLELNEKNRIIEDKQTALLQSIRYAQHIQKSLLTPESYIEKNLLRLKIK